MASSVGEGSRLEYSGHAQVAYEHGALRALAKIGQSGQHIADAAVSGLHSAIPMPLLAGMVASFGMSPMSLPQEDLSNMLRLFSVVYEGRLSWPAFCRLTVLADHVTTPVAASLHSHTSTLNAPLHSSQLDLCQVMA